MTDAAALRASSEVAAPGLGSRWIWHLALGALPIISFYFAEVAMSLTDAAFVGHIGNQELAAVGLSMGSLFPLLFGAIALVSTGGVFIAEAAAVGNQGGAKQSLDLSLWAVVAVSPPLMVCAYLLPWLFEATGQDARVIELSSAYLGVVLWSIPLILGFSVFRTFVAAVNHNRVIFVVSLIGVVLNAALNYLLTFGQMGAPKLGLVGSALSTVISTGVMLLMIAIYCGRELAYSFSLQSLKRLCATQGKELLRLGAPAFAIGVFESSLFGVVAILSGQFGVNVLAATTIAIYVSDLFIVVALGLGDQLTVSVAPHAAAGDGVACRKITKAGVALAVAVSIPMVAVCLLFPETLVDLFLDSSDADANEVLQLSRTLLAVLACFLVADACQVVLSRTLKGMRDTLVPMWIAVVGYWLVGVGGGWLLAHVAGHGGVGLWYGLATGMLLCAGAMGVRAHSVCNSLSEQPPAIDRSI